MKRGALSTPLLLDPRTRLVIHSLFIAVLVQIYLKFLTVRRIQLCWHFCNGYNVIAYFKKK